VKREALSAERKDEKRKAPEDKGIRGVDFGILNFSSFNASRSALCAPRLTKQTK
jgi:hypothetical protein